MSAPAPAIQKTGAWVHLEQLNQWLRCDVYRVAAALIVRCNLRSRQYTPPDDDVVWCTVHRLSVDWIDADVMTCVSDQYTLHYELRYSDGEWRTCKIDKTQE